jgi:hypothetical protein
VCANDEPMLFFCGDGETMAIADGVVRAGRGHCKNLKMSQQEIGDFTIKLVQRAPRHIHVCITNSRARNEK